MLALLDQVGQGLVDQRLQLAAFAARDGAHRGQDLSIHLRRELLTGGHRGLSNLDKVS